MNDARHPRFRPHARPSIGAIGAAIATVWTAIACVSPREPRVLDSADAVLAAPPLLYAYALDRAVERLPQLGTPFAAVPPGRNESVLEQSRRIDLALVASSLGLDPGAATATSRDALAFAAYAAAREAVLERRRQRDRSARWRWAEPDAGVEEATPLPPETSIPPRIPSEHALYMSGLLALEGGDSATALERWSTLLELPEASRRERSVWAAFQAGRALEDRDPDAARAWFRRARGLAAAGMADPLGLAVASLGYEARLDLRAERFAEAIRLYGSQHGAGDPTASQSLRMAVTRLLAASPDACAAVATDNAAAPLVTAVLASDHPFGIGPAADDRAAWVAALDTHGPAVLPDAGRLALTAYRAGEFAAAARWTGRAAADDALAHWITAKLALLDGDLDAADAALVQALQVQGDAFPLAREPRDAWRSDGVELRSQLLGELGAVRLARGRLTEALHLLLQAGRWDDAAYVAERVLTIAELEAYATANWSPEGAGARRGEADESAWPSERDAGAWLRTIVGRRLARAGRWAAAADWFDEVDRRAHAVELHQLLAVAERPDMAPRERARALWHAAVRLRHEGMQIMGTWNGPDGGRTDGAFAAEVIDAVVQMRRANHVTPPTAAELDRVARQGVHPEQRFHYRYLAADLAYEASLLLPDRDPDLALILCNAGSWLAITDPKEADRFYKDLVWRCRPLPIAVEADRRRWFPPCDGEPFAGD